MQKLVTIYLDNAVYGKGKFLTASYADYHGAVQEHLQEHLSQGWRITSITALGGAAESLMVRGWVVALLEK